MFIFITHRLLVGEGAHRFAKERGLCLIDNSTLISDRSLSKYKKYKDRLVEESKNIVDNKLQITVHPTQSQVNMKNGND